MMMRIAAIVVNLNKPSPTIHGTIFTHGIIARILPENDAALSENDAFQGRARIKAHSGKLTLTDIEANDGLVVLPYHWTPRLVSDPPVAIEPITLLDDPVPFIGLRNPPAELELSLKPW